MNEIFKEWLDKQPPLSVNHLHNGQYYLTDEQALDFAKYYSKNQLLLHNVSQQRELLKVFIEWYNKEFENYDQLPKHIIDMFMEETFNCG